MPCDIQMTDPVRLSGAGQRRRFNEAAGADPADAGPAASVVAARGQYGFNEAAGADPADAATRTFNQPADPDCGCLLQ